MQVPHHGAGLQQYRQLPYPWLSDYRYQKNGEYSSNQSNVDSVVE